MVLLIALGVLFTYGVGFAIAFRAAVRQYIWERERSHPHLFKTEADYIKQADRAFEEVGWAAFLWPVGWVFILSARLTRGSIETDRLKRIRAEVELQRIKKLAEENGLSFPDGVYLPALDKRISLMDNKKL